MGTKKAPRLGAATGGNERRRRKNKTLKTKLNHSYALNIPPFLKIENPNFWGFFIVKKHRFFTASTPVFFANHKVYRYNFSSIIY
ncbi:MAG: hypothetical protein EHM12_06920 [Dehalococcoidia bacterium]|nr:MAG: hypothetical protein EHM12_06920 [Dehalococcoidia bacterium]